MPKQDTGYDLFVKRWMWLFPAIYLFHMLEEYYGGFYTWLARLIEAEPPPLQFPVLDTFFLIVMIAGIAAAIVMPFCRWLAVTFALASAMNGLTHLIAGILTMSYSPGVISGAIFWLPLGGYVLYLAYKDLPRTQLALGIILGLVLHVSVCLLVLNAFGTKFLNL